MDEQPQVGREEGIGCGIGDSLDDILLIPEEKNASQRSAKRRQDELSNDVSFFRKRREVKQSEEANKVTREKTSPGSGVQAESDEGSAYSPVSSDDESQPAGRDDGICIKIQRKRNNVPQEGKAQKAPEWQCNPEGPVLASEFLHDDHEYEFDFDGSSSSSQSVKDKSSRGINDSGNEAQKSRNASTAGDEATQSHETVLLAFSNAEPITRKGRRNTSWVHSFVKRKPSGHRVCIHCKARFSPKTGSSSLKYHIENACPANPRAKEHDFDKGKANTLLCRAITEDCLSLRFADSPNLHAFASYLRPGYKPPGRKTLTNNILPHLVAIMEKVIRSKLDSIDYVSVSLDGWTSVAARNYIAILCHGITDSWVLETFLLKVVSVKESETADYVADVTRTALKEWNISLSNVVAVASDGAANMKRSVQHELRLPWIYCLAHAINRSVFKALEREPIKGIVDKAKAICKLFKYPKAKRELRKKQEVLKLRVMNMKLCCPTRWGSTYKMLKRMIASRPAIAVCLATQTRQGQRVQMLSDDEWDVIKQLVSVLRHLNEASQQLSCQKVPTVGLIVPILASLLVDHLDGEDEREEEEDHVSDDESQGNNQTSAHHDVQDFKRFLADDLGKRWDVVQDSAPVELLLSAYLDPRTKDLLSVGDDGGARRKCLAKAQAMAEKLLAKAQTKPQAYCQTNDTMQRDMRQEKGKEKETEKRKGKGEGERTQSESKTQSDE